MQPDHTLRPATPADHPFLLELFASTRGRELDGLPFTPEQRTAFVGQQFSAQRQAYALSLREGTERIVEVDGVAVGQLLTAPLEGTLRVIDIALMPATRGRGLGTALLQRVIGEAEAHGLTTSVHVEVTNPARRLYERLSFSPARAYDGGSHLYLERPPAT